MGGEVRGTVLVAVQERGGLVLILLARGASATVRNVSSTRGRPRELADRMRAAGLAL